MTRMARLTLGTTLLLAAFAAPAAAQYSAPKLTSGAIGETYHIQASAGLWMPDMTGVIASEQFGQIGSKIDFIKDLKFQKKNFADFRFELRPSKRNKLYAMYSPITYSADATLSREIVFNGQKFVANLPIQSTFDWKVWRLGYELDLISLPRGFVGVTIEGRLTDFGASLKAPAYNPEYTRAKGPLPAFGGIARAYIIPRLAITGAVSGFKVPDSLGPDLIGSYIDMDFYATFNINRYAGVQAGWRKMTTNVTIKKDFGDMQYKGIWFGAVVRY